MPFLSLLQSRPALWALGSASFGCLLGHFYGFWSMQAFTPCVLAPVTLLLILLAFKGNPQARRIIVEGSLGGIFAAIVYDLFRLPFVLAGKPLFGVFPKFGQLMLYGHLNQDTGPAVQIAGWSYHFLNGASLGIMFLAMLPLAAKAAPRFWSAVVWAVGVEIFLLISPYYHFLGVDKKLNWTEFLYLTLSAHLVFGMALGWYAVKRLPKPQMQAGRA